MSGIEAVNIIEVKDLEYRLRERIILQNLNFQIGSGELFVITGPSGSGKTTLAEILMGNIPPTEGQILFAEDFEALLVSQQDRFVAASGLRISYYSQRYESLNEENVPSVTAYLHRTVPGIQPDHFSRVLKELEIDHLADRKILSLSNGERKRVQLAEALLQNPEMLVLDQPFIGLDKHSREGLSTILQQQKRAGMTMVIISDALHIPQFSDRVLELDFNAKSKMLNVANFQRSDEKDQVYSVNTDHELLKELSHSDEHSELLVRMRGVNVIYGGKKFLEDIDWEVKADEKWLLFGPNGAGKTTLLSLVSADNPQGYSNDLVIFDRKRGSGESIWDIKKKIGFVSPELHHYFLRRKGIYKPASREAVSYDGMTNLDVVLSGLKDEVGFTSERTKMELEHARKWMRIMGMEHLEKLSFLHSSMGEQRIILLARALVKSPELLILDEPCQGLDQAQIRRFTGLLDHICAGKKTTLIYVTHREEEIPSCITHELELENGRIAANRFRN